MLRRLGESHFAIMPPPPGGTDASGARRPDAAFGPNPRAFGHPGAGGSVGFADPDARLGFGYVMNRMGPHILLDPRATALIEATYACLG